MLKQNEGNEVNTCFTFPDQDQAFLRNEVILEISPTYLTYKFQYEIYRERINDITQPFDGYEKLLRNL